jgi:hypothetical protein
MNKRDNKIKSSGTNNLTNISKQNPNEKNSKQSSFDPGNAYLVEPLDYNRYTRIMNDQEALSQFKIIFGKRINEPNEFYQSYFTGGRNTSGSRLYSEIEFEASLNLWREPPYPDNCYYEYELNNNQLDTIFNHIESNIDYYFNPEEFNGISYPYLTKTPFLHDKNYIFSIIIIKPNPLRPSYPDYFYAAYLINKSVDELIPDTPLYELFQKWETELLPLILQHEKHCD